MLSIILSLCVALQATGTTERVSIADDGAQGNNDSIISSISSDDGRYVAFQSDATTLVSGDDNGKTDVFVYDRNTDKIEIVSVDSNGNEGNGNSGYPSISGDGRYVAFQSDASDLVADDTNNTTDTFVYDRTNDTITRITKSGTEGNLGSLTPRISADGKYVALLSFSTNWMPAQTNGNTTVFVYGVADGQLNELLLSNGDEFNEACGNPSISSYNDKVKIAFQSFATNIVQNDTNAKYDIFVYDQSANTYTRVSVDDTGAQADDGSFNPRISIQGDTVCFESDATNLVAGDDNAKRDIFAYTLSTSKIERVSVADDGTQADNVSYNPVISSDGRYVAFDSLATTLDSGTAAGSQNVFLYDRTDDTITLINVPYTGSAQDSLSSRRPSITADGALVSFDSDVTNLVPNDTNFMKDVFVASWKNVTLTMVNSPIAGGTSDPASGTHSVAAGISQTITATAADGYVFQSWTGSASGVAIDDASSSSTTAVLSDDASITANFATARTLTMAASPSNGGTTDPAIGTHSVGENSVVTITATPASGYVFSTWTATDGASITGSSTSATSTAFVTLDATVTANFTATAILTMAVTPASSGTTTPTAGASTVNQGEAQSITATPASGYVFKSWAADSANGTIADSSSASTTVTLSGDATVTATFVATATLTMAVTPSDSGTTSPAAGASTVNQGEAQSITATPASGYVFKSWAADSANGTIADSSSASTTVTLSGNATVTATFTATATLTMAVSPENSGTTTPAAGTSTVNQGEAQSITATAADGYFFKAWTADSANATIADASSSSTTVTLTGNATVKATFYVVVKLTMAVTPADSGTTVPAPSTGNVEKNVAFSISATAADGYAFLYWTGTANASFADSNSASTTVTCSGDATATANFAATASTATMTMAATPTDGGAVTPVAGSYSVELSSAQSITATAATGYYFSGWTSGETAVFADSSSSSTTVTLSGDATITANFSQSAPTTVTLTVVNDPSDGGTTLPRAGEWPGMVAGIDVRIQASAVEGYNFAGWTVSPEANATITESSDSDTFINASGDVTLTAMFSQVSPDTCAVTFAVDPSDSGTTLPHAGSTAYTYAGVVFSIRAYPADGYSFIGWTGTGNASILDASSASTTANTSGDCTITAMFSSTGAAGSLTVTKLNIGSRGDKTGKDKVTLVALLPDDFSYTPASDDLKVMIGSWEMEVAKGTEWKESGEQLGLSKEIDNVGKVKIKIDPVRKNELSVKVSKATISGKVNSSEGVDVYLHVGSKTYYERLSVEEVAIWKSNEESTKVEGFVAGLAKLSGKYTFKKGVGKSNFTLIGNTLEDPTGGFTVDYTPTVSLDQAEWKIEDDEAKAKNEKFTYKVKTDTQKLQIKLDFSKGKWFFKSKDTESTLAESISRSGTVRVILNFNDGNNEYNSVNTITTVIRSVIKYKRAADAD